MSEFVSDCVVVKQENAIAYVALNRPDKHNGLNYELFQSLIKAAKYLRKQRHIRAVIVSGEGPSFCAGLDFGAVSKTPSMVGKLFLKWPWQRMNDFQRVAQCWRDLPMPVIAAIHGNCFGGGLQIALGADYRIATPNANFSIMEMKWGLIPDMSLMVNISRLMRIDTAQELTMTGRQFSGEQALEYGLVSQLSDTPQEAALALANTLAEQSPDAVAAAKYLFKKAWKADANKALRLERWTQLRILGRTNQRIAMKNGLAKGQDAKPFEDRRSF